MYKSSPAARWTAFLFMIFSIYSIGSVERKGQAVSSKNVFGGRQKGCGWIAQSCLLLIGVLVGGLTPLATSAAHVYEIVPVEFRAATAKSARESYRLPLDVQLTGPDGQQFVVPAFWYGGDVWRVRLVATATGLWRWSTGQQTGDQGLDGQAGSFIAEPWAQAEIAANPNRRGFIKVAPTGRTFVYADGSPCFFLSDTWWSALTKIYAWDSSAGVAGCSFQDGVKKRKMQGFNGLNIIASFPSDTVKGIWHPATRKQKIAEDGATPFRLDGKRVDWCEIQPAYWQAADRKMEYLWEQGFVVFLETVRRHESWPDASSEDKAAFTSYCRYLRARYGCYNIIFSWLHWDYDAKEFAHWWPLVKSAYEALGPMPYGQPMTAMAAGSTLDNYYRKKPLVIEVQNVSNLGRDFRMFDWLLAQFRAQPLMPSINLEPYYPEFDNGENNRADRGKLDVASMAQYMAYGSVLSGALAGHSWGDACFGGVHSETGEAHAACFDRWNAASLGIMKDFFLHSGHDWTKLVPSHNAFQQRDVRFRVFASDESRSFGLGYLAAGYGSDVLVHLSPKRTYELEWWDPRKGGFTSAKRVQSDTDGHLHLPEPPNTDAWAFRLKTYQPDGAERK